MQSARQETVWQPALIWTYLVGLTSPVGRHGKRASQGHRANEREFALLSPRHRRSFPMTNWPRLPQVLPMAGRFDFSADGDDA